MIMVGVCITRRNVIFQTCGRSHWTRLLVCLLLGWETVSHVSQTFLDLCGTVNDLEFLFFPPMFTPKWWDYKLGTILLIFFRASIG